MNILKKIFEFFITGVSSTSLDDAFFMVIKCGMCNEEIRVRVNKKYDLQSNYLDSDGPAWTLQKEVMGNKCNNLIKVHLEFNSRYKVVNQDITNGELVELEK